MSSPTSLLYQPSSTNTATQRFLDRINANYGLSLASYSDLYQWSTTHIDDFWGSVWDETKILGHKGKLVVDKDAKPAENVPWFSEAQLNWAENMLQHRSTSKIALIQASQCHRPLHRMFIHFGRDLSFSPQRNQPQKTLILN